MMTHLETWKNFSGNFFFNFRKSQELEPDDAVANSSVSFSNAANASLVVVDGPASRSFVSKGLPPVRSSAAVPSAFAKTQSLTPQAKLIGTGSQKFRQTHRKTQSLGSDALFRY